MRPGLSVAIVSSVHGSETADELSELASSLRASGLTVAGFVQPRGLDAQGRARHELLRLRTEERIGLAVAGVVPRGPDEESFCSKAFSLGSFDTALEWIREDGPKSDVVILDGLGKLEAAGRGHSRALDAALVSARSRSSGPALIVVGARTSQLTYLLDRFGWGEDLLWAALELPAGDASRAEFRRRLLSAFQPT